MSIPLLTKALSPISSAAKKAMEVYEFQHGEKVVRQGDTDGAHHEGDMCGRPVRYSGELEQDLTAAKEFPALTCR